MLQMLEDIRDGVTETMVENTAEGLQIGSSNCQRQQQTREDCKVAFTMAEDAHMSEVMHEKIQWTFVKVQQIWLEVREGVFQKWKAAK